MFHAQLRVLSIYHRHATHVSRVARLFDGVKRDTSSVWRDRWENSISDLFLCGNVKIGDVNGVIAFKSDAPVTRKSGCQRGS